MFYGRPLNKTLNDALKRTLLRDPPENQSHSPLRSFAPAPNPNEQKFQCIEQPAETDGRRPRRGKKQIFSIETMAHLMH